VHGLLADPEDPRNGQAKRVTESYERERFAGLNRSGLIGGSNS
jgi:hypothetical protein